ncbi:acyltransferase family protein [Streptococcus suis]|uniref:acyltransferase family protein n=1 Tax=Streptococcus suis TaxID=1307 RepID=UPI003F8C3403
MQNKTKPLNTSLLSLIQFIGAILVIALHCRRLFEAEQLHFIQKSIFSRMVVPYFMVTASFFLRRNYPSLSKQYLIRYSKQYLTWSALYLPFYLIYLTLQEIPFPYYPLALLVGLTYTGTSYQLWYMPAFLLGLVLVHFSLEKWGWRITACLACLLYLLGSVETYSSYLAESIFLTAFDSYKTFFFTSRNGLFYAPIFVLTGFYLADKLNHPIFQYRQKNKLLVCSALLAFEATVIYLKQGYDKNFLFSLIPFTAYLVAWTLTTDLFRKKKFQFLKEYASYYYFIHVIPVEISFFFLETSSLTKIQQGWLVFFITIITCQLLSWLIINTQRKSKTD